MIAPARAGIELFAYANQSEVRTESRRGQSGRNRAALHPAGSHCRGQPLPVLFRCSLHPGRPTGIDIPSFIKKIVNGNLTGSARTILSANILGASCARVCPTEALCEGACVMVDREGDPVKIGRLQRYATDHVLQNQIQVLKAPAQKSGKRFASSAAGL